MKKVAILQSNYIPWKGYFDLINSVDEFIIYDDVQYTNRDWRNRNKIKTAQGTKWITIPLSVKKRSQKINETTIANKNWTKKHVNTIITNYSKAPYFDHYSSQLFALYVQLKNEMYLSAINYTFIKKICEILDIDTTFSWSSDYKLIDGKTERLVDLCKQANATEYISGPAARDYIDESLFAEEGIKLTWMNYDGYPEYEQLFPPFEHNVSIIDLIFNCGPNSRKYMKSG